MRYCEVCGHVFDEFDTCRDDTNCDICGATLSEDDMTALKYAELSEADKDIYDKNLLSLIKGKPWFKESLFQKYCSMDTGDFWCGFRIEKYAKFKPNEDVEYFKSQRKRNEPFKQFEPIDRDKALQCTYKTVEKQLLEEQKAQSANIPKCPTCGSTNVQRIGTGEKAVSGALWGLFSTKIRKSYKCNNCKYMW